MKEETKKKLYEKLVLYREDRKFANLFVDRVVSLGCAVIALLAFFAAVASSNSKPLHIELVVVYMGVSILFAILSVYSTFEFYRDSDRWNEAIKNAEALYNEVVEATESTKK
ncbi:MAG: hypothetical protein NT130_05815 [Candidatus Micrarchaeota archaeon]|nr:hypothetical protein [Candidatus Micrarchaeota archaeon]